MILSKKLKKLLDYHILIWLLVVMVEEKLAVEWFGGM